jgi:histidinol-phosphate aminotransferase
MSFLSDRAKKVVPYIPGEQPKDRKYIKLNTNENPYPPSDDVLEAIRNCATDETRLYPPPECENLKEIISTYYDVDRDMVFTGNGSDEVLAFSYMAFLNPGDVQYSLNITYSFYPVYSNFFNIDYREISLNDDFSVPVDLLCNKDGSIIIANPNAPTGIALGIDEIEKIISSNKRNLVIIDEAYIDFGAESCVFLTKKYKNLLVIKTMSKSRSIAGLRAGYAIGNRELIDGLDRVKNSINSYTMTRITQDAASAAFINEDYFQSVKEKIINIREDVIKELRASGFKTTDSKANFIFISHDKIKAEVIFNKLREKGILVRYFKKPLIDNYLRVTIGNRDEMDVFIKKVKEILEEN